MKTGIRVSLIIFSFCFLPFIAQSQSTLEIQPGTTVEVTPGADVCADNFLINGTITGGGTRCNGILPVELISFTAIVKFSYIELQWKTATEVNNAGFDIERRTNNAGSWGKVGSVAGAGSSSSPRNYSYRDNVGSAGRFTYRLKQVDRNGTFEYSPEAEVSIESPKVFSLEQNYPDPFNPSTTIQFTVPSNGRATLKVYNALGQNMVTLFDDEAMTGVYHQVLFDASSLATGTYYARLEFNGNVQLKKMLLLK